MQRVRIDKGRWNAVFQLAAAMFVAFPTGGLEIDARALVIMLA
jgi:hypothetical protein